MSRLLLRHRKYLTSTVLGLWVFALFVGSANACSWDGVTTDSHKSTMAVHAVGDVMDDDVAPGCDDLPSNDLPLPSVLQLVQDLPAGPALSVATHHGLRSVPNSAPLFQMARLAHPPPGVPFSLRIVRLTV